MKAIKILLLVLCFNLSANVFSKEQLANIAAFTNAVDKNLHKLDPEYEVFYKYLFGMYMQESSCGVHSYSDNRGDEYYYIHQNKKMYVDKTVYNKAFYFKTKKGKYIYKNGVVKTVFVVKNKRKPMVKASLGPLMMKVSTVRYIIEQYKLKEYYGYLIDDDKIIDKLINDYEFSVFFTLKYLKMNYDVAVKRGYDKPILRAVSRHNGGWSNNVYIKKVHHGIQYVIAGIESSLGQRNTGVYISTS